MDLEFEWDTRKAYANQRKHGVSFEEAVSVFGDSLARIFDDPAHSEAERREVIVGYSEQGRLLLVAFAERGPTVRIISARSATPRERSSHEQETEKRRQQ